jgi:RNA polymerase sigma factor (sigma-70 family)
MPDTSETDSGEVSDETLMHRLVHGDNEALTKLMVRWEIGLKSFLLRLGLPESDVEDVAQEAFVKVYRSRMRYRAAAPFKPWILTIAGNLARNRMRWRFRRREDSFHDLNGPVAEGFEWEDETAISGRTQAERRNLGQMIQTAIHSLPSKLRTAIVCVEIENLSHREAAEVAGCSAKAIESRLARAKSKLRDLLRESL